MSHYARSPKEIWKRAKHCIERLDEKDEVSETQFLIAQRINYSKKRWLREEMAFLSVKTSAPERPGTTGIGIIEGNLEVKLLTIWTCRWKSSGVSQRRSEKRREGKRRGEKRREEKRREERRREEERREEKRREEKRRRKKITDEKESEERRSQTRKSQKKEDHRRERVRRKKMQAREELEKSRITVFFQWFVAPEGRKVGSLKRRVRSHLARWEMKSCTLLWREAHFEVKMYKTPHVRSAFGSWDVEKVHAVVAWSPRTSQNAQSTSCSEHFWKLTCLKSVRGCGAKHISKSNAQNTSCSEHFWKLTCRKSARRCGAKRVSKSKC